MKEELLKGLTEDQIAKIKACKSQEEMLAFAKEEGIELTDEQLAAVSGGCMTPSYVCPSCGSKGEYREKYEGGVNYVYCAKCGTLIHTYDQPPHMMID